MYRKLREFGSRMVQIEIDGTAVAAELGECVAAVILRQEEIWTRRTPTNEKKRAPYCLMGVCFDCLAEVDGEPSIQTCLVPVRDGMKIVRQTSRRKLKK